MSDTPITTFADELDSLLNRWADKVQDDQPTKAEVVGALLFAAHNLMAKARDEQEAK